MSQSYHCRHCKPATPRPHPPGRNQALEAFLATWARTNGYKITLQHGEKKTVARLTRD